MNYFGAYLPGNSTVELRPFVVPTPGHGQVLLATKYSAICGSDIRCIYHQHLGLGPERYQNVVAGHEPAGEIISCGPGVKRFRTGDRVLVYHISGCGLCHSCRRGYMISCSSVHRAAYGWQRDGGMAPFMLVEERDLVRLPDELSYADGAQVACGFGTAYEALVKLSVSGLDRVLVTGLGPVGLATLMLAKAMGASRLIGVDTNAARCALAVKLGLATDVVGFDTEALEKIQCMTKGQGVEKAIDCSGRNEARQLCVRSVGDRGSIALVGEGGEMDLIPSPDVIHGNKVIIGSWVTSIWRMEELVDRIARWGIHPDVLITHRFELSAVSEAYALMASGQCGKVAVTFEEEAE